MTQRPVVSIVTPSYNQAEYLEETMLSVLNQNYPNIEYIVIDGGSGDGSPDIIHRYADRLAYWVSEPDRGQAHALQKGFSRASGEIMAFLNSDDVYLPGAVDTAVGALQVDPGLAMIHGDSIFVDGDGQEIGRKVGLEGDFLKYFLLQLNPISQPSAFIRWRAYDLVGGIDPTLQMTMDYDLWCRMLLRGMRAQHVPVALSRFRIHDRSKTKRSIVASAEERWRLLGQYLDHPELGPSLAPYRKRLYGMAHLRFANAHWISGNNQEAYTHFQQMLRMAPQCVFTRTGVSLVMRFVLGRRYLRRRTMVQVD
jgi:GT2 family glycosyltransferase